MNITLEWLKRNRACKESIQAWKNYGLESLDIFECIELLKAEQENIAANYDNENSLLWCTWLLPHCMKPNRMVKYTEFCAKLTARVARTDTARAVKAEAARIAKWAAEYAEYVAKAARVVKAEAARVAKWAARAANAAEYAEYAARAARVAKWAARAAEWAAGRGDEASLKIIEYGIKLLKESLADADNKKNKEN